MHTVKCFFFFVIFFSSVFLLLLQYSLLYFHLLLSVVSNVTVFLFHFTLICFFSLSMCIYYSTNYKKRIMIQMHILQCHLLSITYFLTFFVLNFFRLILRLLINLIHYFLCTLFSCSRFYFAVFSEHTVFVFCCSSSLFLVRPSSKMHVILQVFSYVSRH